MSHRLVRHPGKYTKCRPSGRHFALETDQSLLHVADDRSERLRTCSTATTLSSIQV